MLLTQLRRTCACGSTAPWVRAFAIRVVPVAELVCHRTVRASRKLALLFVGAMPKAEAAGAHQCLAAVLGTCYRRNLQLELFYLRTLFLELGIKFCSIAISCLHISYR